MSSLKKRQQALLSAYPPQAIITHSFPAFWYYGVNAKWTYKDIQFGMSVSFGSTGGRVYYSDYSGMISEEHMLKYTSVNSIIAKKWSFGDDKLVITFDPRIGLVFGNLLVDESFHVAGGDTGGLHSQGSYKYRAMNISMEPTLSVFHRFGPIGITAFAGYHVDVSLSPFRQTNGSTLNSSSTGSDPVQMNLQGYRVGGAVGLYFKKGTSTEFTRLYVAPGIGLDFGGIGLNFTAMATRHIGFFAGLGYNFHGVGTNGGVRVFITDEHASVRPYFSLMYGYNAVVVIKNADQYNRTFYGTSLAFGTDIKASENNFWTVGVGIPIRNSEVEPYMNYLKSNGVTFGRRLLPVTLSLGYRIAIKD
jgi:hypothetical protein